MRQKGVILLAWLVILLASGATVSGQAPRVTDRNRLGWYVYNGDHQLSHKWQLHTEYQWRRIDFIRTWQQSLARVGLDYQLRKDLQAGTGYTYLVTFPYGEHPVADGGVPTR